MALTIFGLPWTVLGGWDAATDKLKDVSTLFYVVSWFVALGVLLFATIWLVFICASRFRRYRHDQREADKAAAQRTTSNLIRCTETVDTWATERAFGDPIELAHRTRIGIDVLVGAGLLPDVGTDLMRNPELLHHYATEAKALLEIYGYKQTVSILAKRREEELRQQAEAALESSREQTHI